MPFLIFAVEISSRKSVAFRKLTWIVNVFFFFFGRKLHYICLFPPFFWWKYLCQISFFCAIYFLETKLLKNPRKMNSFREYNTFSSSNNFILFEIDCAIFDTNLHQLFCQFRNWTNWVNSGKFMDSCWISYLIWKKFRTISQLITINLYR